MTSHELNALTGAYAVDALDEHERALFEAHLAICAECKAEVRSLSAAAAELSQLTVVAPPPALRADILRAADHLRPMPPLRNSVSTLRAGPPTRWWWPAVAAACVLIAIAGAGWGYQQHRDANRVHAQATALTKVLDSPDARTVTGAIGATGHAALVYSKAQQRLVLIARGIAEPAEDKTYQLWMIDPKGTATSAGLFRPDRNGNVLVQATGDLSNTARMGISIERAGGAPEPTPGAIVAAMTL
jgi:anti-sigma-K factor RskA